MLRNSFSQELFFKDDMVNRLVERYLDTCPGVIPSKISGSDHDRFSAREVLEILFSSQAPAIRYLTSLLPSRCPKSARVATLDYLLQTHRTQ